MKHLKLLFLLTILVSMMGVEAFAYVAYIDGIYYSFSGTEATVSGNGGNNSYTGNVVIPESVTYKGTTYAVTSIYQSAFYNCYGLTSVTIPNSVTSIEGDAFYGTEWYNNQPNGLVYAGKVAYKYKGTMPSNTSIILEEGTLGIAGGAFYGCSGLTSVTIPNSVTSIGGDAFSGCSSLTSITIPSSVTSISNAAFFGCKGLTSVTIPNSVTSIGQYAFSGCSSLETVTIGSGVLSIGGNMFLNSYGGHRPAKVIWLTNTPPSGYNNAAGTINYVANDQYTSLSNKTVYKFLSSTFEVDGVRYVPVSPSERTCDAIDCTYEPTAENLTIGETVEYKGVKMKVSQVHPYACYSNQRIKDVKINCSGNVGNYAFFNCKELTNVLANNGGNIGDYAFSKSSKLVEAQINNKGTIGNYAFQSCIALQTATLGEQVTGIGQYAFQSCTALQTATLGEQVAGIGQYAFSVCTNLQSIVVPDAVKTMGQYAFQNCTSMESVKMGTGVETIETYTFTECLALKDMEIGSNVKRIDRYAFNNCKSLTSIRIPQAVNVVNSDVFNNCSGLENVYISDRSSVLTLGWNNKNSTGYKLPLFSDCPLDSVYIGGDIYYYADESHGYSPFYRNTSLRSVHITDQETEISPNEFYGCTGLKNVRIGDGVTTIGNWAFSGCSSLDYFQFGASVETIGQEAFSDCVAVTKVISRASTPPTCGSQALDDLNKWECHLEVPEGMAGAYSEASQWKEFFFMEEGDAAVTWHKLIYEVDGETFKTVDVAAGATITPEQAPAKAGFTFAGWTNLPATMPAHDVTVTARYVLADGDDMSIRGDLNNDGFVNMADVTKLIDYILGRTQQ